METVPKEVQYAVLQSQFGFFPAITSFYLFQSMKLKSHQISKKSEFTPPKNTQLVGAHARCVHESHRNSHSIPLIEPPWRRYQAPGIPAVPQ